jgi:hypothetical protein
MKLIATIDFSFNEVVARKGDLLDLDEVLSARLLRAGCVQKAQEPKAEVTTPPSPVLKPKPTVKAKAKKK